MLKEIFALITMPIGIALLVLYGLGIFATAKYSIEKKHYKPFCSVSIAVLMALPFFVYAGAAAYTFGSGLGELLSPLSTATPAPVSATPAPTSAPVTRPYTFTLTHNIVEGRSDCKWTFEQSVNGEDVSNNGTVNIVPGNTIHLRTSITETSGTNATGSDACKLENPPTGTFSIRRTIDAVNAGGVITRWDVVYTFTPQWDYKTESQGTFQGQDIEDYSPNYDDDDYYDDYYDDDDDYSGPWGTDDTTDETVGSLDRTVYWVPNGKSYHFSLSCPSLSRSPEIYEGTLREAIDEGKTDPCNNCVW